jgi:uncharacterized BrkB/YihY/UPF0761 family membrane protein
MASDARSRPEAIRDFGLHAAELAKERIPGAPAVVESLERERLAGSGLLAGGIAYRFFIWLVPFGLVLAGLGSVWNDEDPEGIESAARQFGLSGAAARSAESAFRSSEHSRWYLIGAGVVLLLWFGIGGVRALRVAHAIAWADPAPKLRKPLHASLVFSGFVIGLGLVSSGARWIQHEVGQTAGLLVSLAALAFYVGASFAAMNLLPHADAPWRALLPGTCVLAVGLVLLHIGVVLYLAPKIGRSTSLYGAFGAATVVLLWLYIIARLIVSAAFFNATLWDRRRRAAA